MLSALIIDDDFNCRKIIKNILEKEFKGSVVAELSARNVDEAVAAYQEHKPGLIFLDVELGNQTGFDFLERANLENAKVIFTTAHADYAVKAFKVNAIDYLLKPFSPSELITAVEKALKEPALKPAEQNIDSLMRYIQGDFSRLGLPTQSGIEFIRVSDIIRCHAEGNYTKFFMKTGKSYLVSKTIKVYEKLLENEGFCRVHASHLINMKELTSYRKGEGGEAIMTDGSSVEVSRSRRDEFLSKLRY